MESLVGKKIDSYQLLEIIGRGGMGVVFKALDTNLDKIVALKMIDPVLARDENFVRRFKTEAKALARLENPNIVTVHALRDMESGFFMVMEYVESCTLSQSLREKGAFNIGSTISIARQMLNALGHAHKLGIIHRDIKPSNVLLCPDGRIKVMDFGLAKVAQQSDPANTTTQTRAGTLYYMSPEQIKGLKNVDSRSDLYSFGMTLYEMTAGRVPFDKTESDFTIQKMIVEGEIPSPVKFNPSLPKKFTKIICRCLEKDPAKRYQTAEEILKDIELFERDRKSAASEATVIDQSGETVFLGAQKKKSFKVPVLYSLAGITILALVLYFIFSAGENEFLISVSSNPSGSMFLINDIPAGESPLKNYQVNGKNVNLKITKEGFIPLDTSLTLKEGLDNNFNFVLSELRNEFIQISTFPDQALTIIDNKNAGNSPLQNYALTAGIHQIRIEKEGYVPLDSQFNITAGSDNNFYFRLSKSEDPAINENAGTDKLTVKLNVSSDPAGAEILIDKKKKGKTPFTMQLAPGSYDIMISKTGFKSYSEKVIIEKDSPAIRKIDKILEPFSAVVEVLVRPYGSIYIDDKLKIQNTSSLFSATLSGGNYKLKVIHPTLGEVTKQIDIDGENTRKYYFDLSRVLKLTIVSDPPNCELLVNGQPTGKYTPVRYEFRKPGTYKIALQKEGWISYEDQYQVPSGIYEKTDDTEDSKRITLTKINQE